ncbi:hypothetical protein [Spirosoma sp.]|uniref:hypothetical protein n=1 Tax=Spirosoma sp. TaxID=1899569 RepID=UPI003B3BC9D2
MKRISILTSILVCAATFAYSQRVNPTNQTVIILPVDQSTIAYKYHDGTALLADGSLLKGRFQFNGRKLFTYRASSQATRQKIGLSMIKRLVLAGSDTLVSDRTDSTVFTRLGNRLYRQLTEGTTMILDQCILVDEDRGRIGRKVYVLTDDGEMRKFTSLQKFNKWFYTFREQSGKPAPDAYLNQNEIVKAVARLND